MYIGWIEDDEGIVETLKLSLEAKGLADKFRLIPFQDFSSALTESEKYDLSLMIVDLKNDKTGEADGKDIISQIFNKAFCPIIISTASSSGDIDKSILSHPLVSYVQKGDKWDENIILILSELSKKIDFIENVKETIKSVNYKLLQSWFPTLDSSLNDDEKSRLFIRRFAASLDFTFHIAQSTLHPYEMYLFPPIPNTDLLTGDILKKEDGNYFLLLSPSCDMVNCRKTEFAEKERRPNLTTVLVAKLIEKVVDSNFSSKEAKNSLKKQIEDLRKKEPESGAMVLPRINHEVPGFVVDLKALSIIPINNIACDPTNPKEYTRLASIDSPFREYIANCVARYFGRMGLPELDYEKWADEVWKVHPKNEVNIEKNKTKTN